MLDPVMQQLITEVIFFIIGNITGYITHDFLKRSMAINDNTSKNILLYVVTFIWGLGMIVSVINPAYNVPVPVHAIMGAIVGFFFYRPKNV